MFRISAKANTLFQSLASTKQNAITSPNRALIFRGTKSSARVTPTFTIAVAAPALLAAL